MKKVLILFFISLSCVFAKNIAIYVIDQSHLNNTDKIEQILPSDRNTEVVIIDGIDGNVIFREDSSKVSDDVLFFEKVKKEEIDSIATPYVIESIYKTLLPNEYDQIKIFFLNAIFYKKDNFDFEKGIPSDFFLISENSEFKYLNIFGGNIQSYIIVDDNYFINNEHKKGLKRFYYLLFERLHLNLYSFSPSYTPKKEKINVEPLSTDKRFAKLSVSMSPPKKIHYQEDEFKITHDQNKGLIYGYVKNGARKNSAISLRLNDQPYSFDCDAQGICRFRLDLALGENVFRFKKMDNTEVVKHYNSKYIPNDKIRFVVVHSEDSDGMKEIFRLESLKTYRPIGSKVELEYQEEHKKLYATVDESGYYKFEVPLKHIYNTFILKEYNGQKNRIDVTNTILKKKEEERIRKLKEEEARRAEEARRKKEEEARRRAAEAKRKAEEARRKQEEALKKKGLIKIDSIKNNSAFKGKDGDPRINLSWEGRDDLDLLVMDPCGNKIYFSSKKQTCQGKVGELDIDANNGKIVNSPQENITWETGGPVGNYKIGVHLYKNREHKKEVPIVITIVNDGETYQKRGVVKEGQNFVFQIEHKGEAQ